MPKEIIVTLTERGLDAIVKVLRENAKKCIFKLRQCDRERQAIKAHAALNNNDAASTGMLNSNDLAQNLYHSELSNWMALYRAIKGDVSAEFLHRMLNELGEGAL